VLSLLQGMQEYLNEAKVLRDFEMLEKQHGGVIAECLTLFMNGTYPERMAAIDFVDDYVPQIEYTGTDEMALKYIASLGNIRDGMNTAKVGITNNNNSLIQDGLEQVLVGAEVNAEFTKRMIAYYEKELLVLTAAGELN